jgi:hypothetical protein
MEPNEKKIAIMVVEEKEVKKPEKKIVTVELPDKWGEMETRVLRLTPEQYRLLEWLEEHEMLSESLEWHDGEPKVEIEEI